MAKSWSQLSESSKRTLVNRVEKVHKAGYSVQEAIKMSPTKFKGVIGSSAKVNTIKAYQRNLRSAIDTQTKQTAIKNRITSNFVKNGWKGKALSRMSTQVSKTVGLNPFFDIAKKIQKKQKVTKQMSFKAARNLIEAAKRSYQGLNQADKEVLSYFS